MIYPAINNRPLVAPAKRIVSKKALKNIKHSGQVIIYIGLSSGSVIDALNSLGYEVLITRDNQEGIRHLFKSCSQEGNLPELFIVEGEILLRGDKDLLKTLRVINEFKSIPLLLVVPPKPGDLLSKLGDITGVDDIVSDRITEEQLQEKIRLLRKFRQLNLQAQSKHATSSAKTNIYSIIGNLLKRTMDIIAAGCILAALSPFLLLIMIAIRIESKGPVFYISLRAGKDYKIFRFYKFRTMVANADKKLEQVAHLNQYNTGEENTAVFIKVNNDPRVTKVGSFLRKTSLDEFPQLINVLKGDMSLVGNRPLPLYEASSLTTDQWVERFLAPAGMTGLWQISKRGRKDMSASERIGLDIDYANKSSFLYDLWIMLRTPSAIIQKENV